jgi:dihydropyrimidinase/allantoinase
MIDKVSKKEFAIGDIVKFYSSNPAERFGISHLMGSIAPGLSANITILDMKKTHHYNSDQQFSHAKASDVLYSGKKFNGKIEKTIVNGKVVYDGKAVLPLQVGRFINPNNKIL